MIKLFYQDIFAGATYHIADTILKTNAKTFEHTHDFFEIFIVTEGKIAHLTGTAEEYLEKRQLVFVEPDSVHSFRKLSSTNAHFVNIAFTKELYSYIRKMYFRYMEKTGEERDFQTSVLVPEKLYESILLRIAYINEQQILPGEKNVENILAGLLLEMLMLLYSENIQKTPAPQWLSHAYERMREPQNFIMGIQCFVKISGKSQEHLTRSMKKFYQLTPSAYINNLRLNYAAGLLKTTDLPVLEILLESGFSSVAFFNQQFKKTFQMTPSRYRDITLA